MSNNLKGMKLLVLGANPETVPLIETAQSLGVYVVVTDNDPNAYAKKFANQPENIDGMDVKKLIKLIKNEKINGVIVGVADRLIKPYQEVCDELQFPCYCTNEQAQIFTDKEIFNKKCMEYEISPIPFYEITQFPSFNEINALEYPIVVKPVDGNSGRGMYICKEPSEVEIAMEVATRASKKGRVLIERYMDCEGVGIYYTFKDGEIFLSAFYDRFTSKKQGKLSQVPLGAIYPSKFHSLFIKNLHPKFCELFRDLKIRNGVLMLSAFVENDNFYVYDPGFRLQGEAPNFLIESVNGFDQKAMLVRFALTGSMGNDDLHVLNDSSFRGKYAASVWFLAKEGQISNIKGLELAHADPNVVAVIQRFEIGDIVSSSVIGTEGQVVLRLYISCNSKFDLCEKINFYQKNIVILDVSGESLIFDHFNSNFAIN
ncbi:ATP-grasp domain-containing protein [Rhodobacterales bacterium HKCCD6035]|nr:ATP-grasp domain-containing protein [Rhodobacterales bacterium HKCCD6035]